MMKDVIVPFTYFETREKKLSARIDHEDENNSFVVPMT